MCDPGDRMTPVIIFPPILGFLGFLAFLWGGTTLRLLQPMSWPEGVTMVEWRAPWIAQMMAPDPVVEAIVDQYLANLEGLGFAPETQGVWIQTGITAIASNQGTVPLSAASLTKLATTLAALGAWPIDHRFETRLGRRGTVVDGVLQGDLVVLGGSDPYFVWEEAIALGHALQQAGIQRVTGNLVILGDFTMNFEVDPQRSGEMLRQGINADLWPWEARQQYDTLPPGIPQPQVEVEGTVVVGNPQAINEVSGWVLRHQSLPLVALLKAMNIYSNNAMAEGIAQTVGGVNTVTAIAAEQAQLSVAEIRLINGSGLGVENRISPRAVVAMLMATQRKLAPHGLSIADVMPVFGQDVGTLQGRDLPPQSALKTGSLAAVSSLAGFFPTRDRGPVWFAILNEGYNLEGFRARQDVLLAALQDHWGAAPAPETFQPQVKLGQPPYQLGDPARNQPY